jgi:hypothetical protein
VDLQPALPSIRQGKVRALGVTAQKRVAAASDIPTLAESGLRGFELVAWQGVVAPAGTPRAIIDELVRQIGKLLADPATSKRFAAMAIEPNRRIEAGRFRRLYQERDRPVGSDCQKVADKTGMTSRVVSSTQGALSWVGPGPPG